MSKLQRAVDGQTIQFLALPKIFNSLSADLPSGAIKLPNGEIAYWRLHRNLTELKKNRKNIKDLTTKLAQALKALVTSDAFLNHYGLAKGPEIETEAKLVQLFRNLLGLNSNRVEYTTISHGRSKPLIEQIIVSLGNLVYFNAYRGMAEQPKSPGIKGKLWLNDGADESQFFMFTIVSPAVALSDYISADRLKAEVLNKLKQNLPIMVHNPRIEFAEGQFENYVGRGVEALAAQHGHALVKKDKKPVLVAKAPKVESPAAPVADETSLQELIETRIHTKESFAELNDAEQTAYVQAIMDVTVDVVSGKSPEKAAMIPAFLFSGVMEPQWLANNVSSGVRYTHAFYLARVLGLSEAQFDEVTGGAEPKYLETKAIPAELTPGITGGEVDMEKLTEFMTSEGLVTEEPVPGSGYCIKAGDSLYSISEAAYGDGDLWTNIHLLNKDVLPVPDDLPVGTLIKIPNLAKEEAPFDYSATGSVGADPEDLPEDVADIDPPAVESEVEVKVA